jgi:cytochrome oxidase Cu insertion factor (SCO1/SenC/PrrC family)
MLLLLGAISLAPFVGSLLLYHFWKPQSFTNYGDLLAVIPLAEIPVKARDGSVFRFSELRGKWAFVMVDAGACDDYCKSKLYLMRQIRLTQGKDQERIERLWLISDGRRPAPELEAQYAGTREVLVEGDEFLRKLPAVASPSDHVYVVDPFGNLMMRFPRDADLQRVKKDIGKLMKASSGWVQTDK